MWLYLVGIVLVVGGAVGSIATGGIFTIVLIPLGLVILVGTIAYRGMGAFTQRSQGGTGVGEPPLPTAAPDNPGHVRTTPEALTDARRAEQ